MARFSGTSEDRERRGSRLPQRGDIRGCGAVLLGGCAHDADGDAAGVFDDGVADTPERVAGGAEAAVTGRREFAVEPRLLVRRRGNR